MRQRLLTRGWVAAHVFVLVCVIVFPMLGWWQWQVAQSLTGSMRNFGYALQWPVFAALLVYVWARHMRDELRPRDEGDGEGSEDRTGASEGRELSGGARVRALTKEQTRPRPAGQLSLASKNRPALPSEDDDADLVAYNRYLAQLSARHERQGQ